MSLSLSKKSSLIAQSEIRARTLECARIGGINFAEGVCDTEVPLPVYVSMNPRDWIFTGRSGGDGELDEACRWLAKGGET